MIGLLIRALGFALTTAGGWVVSDIFNEHQTTKQQSPQTPIIETAKKSASKNWVRWAVFAGGIVVMFVVWAKLLKPMLLKKGVKQEVIV